MTRPTVLWLVELLALAMSMSLVAAEDKGTKKVPPVLNFKMNNLAGQPVDLARYNGKVLLIVNVASECGYTPQYKGLQDLHTKYAKDGLVVLGIPSNDFGQQEPGSNEQIAAFCKRNYGVTFDLFAKVPIQGKNQASLYRLLTSKEANPRFAGPVQWNFEKFLIGRKGEVAGRFASDVEPDSEQMVKAIEVELARN